MIIQVVTFTSDLSAAEARRVMEERAPQYLAQPGLLQKYYTHEPSTGRFGGVYVWDSEASLQAFRSSDLARSISEAYRVKGQAQMETFEVLFPLRAEELAAAH